jgi:hypothetical protein
MSQTVTGSYFSILFHNNLNKKKSEYTLPLWWFRFVLKKVDLVYNKVEAVAASTLCGSVTLLTAI